MCKQVKHLCAVCRSQPFSGGEAKLNFPAAPCAARWCGSVQVVSQRLCKISKCMAKLVASVLSVREPHKSLHYRVSHFHPQCYCSASRADIYWQKAAQDGPGEQHTAPFNTLKQAQLHLPCGCTTPTCIISFASV